MMRQGAGATRGVARRGGFGARRGAGSGRRRARRTRPLLTANLRQSAVGKMPSVSTPRNSPTQRSMVSAMARARGSVRRRARGEAGRAHERPSRPGVKGRKEIGARFPR